MPDPAQDPRLGHRRLFRERRIGGETFHGIDWTHPEVEARVLEEMGRGFDVYYDREWPLTVRFCEFLLQHPALLRHRRVFVAGAGVGLEAVVAGRLARFVWVNDRSPVALDLLAMQLRRNGIEAFEQLPGSFDRVPLPPEAGLVLASFVVYDRATADATSRLVAEAAGRNVPVLLANQEIQGHFGRVREASAGSWQELHRERELRILLFHGPASGGTPPISGPPRSPRP